MPVTALETLYLLRRTRRNGSLKPSGKRIKIVGSYGSFVRRIDPLPSTAESYGNSRDSKTSIREQKAIKKSYEILVIALAEDGESVDNKVAATLACISCLSLTVMILHPDYSNHHTVQEAKV